MTRFFCFRRSEAKMLQDSEQRHWYCWHAMDHNVLSELNYAFLKMHKEMQSSQKWHDTLLKFQKKTRIFFLAQKNLKDLSSLKTFPLIRWKLEQNPMKRNFLFLFRNLHVWANLIIITTAIKMIEIWISNKRMIDIFGLLLKLWGAVCKKNISERFITKSS